MRSTVAITVPPVPPEARAALQPMAGILIEPLEFGALPATPSAQGAPSVTGASLFESMKSGCVTSASSPFNLLTIWFLPFTCAGGAVRGVANTAASGAAAAQQARTSEEVEIARVSLYAAVTALDPAADLGEQLLARGELDGVPRLLGCTPGDGCVTDEHGASPAVLRLAVQPVFASKGTFNPEVTLLITVRGRVVDASGAELTWRCWRYRSPAVSYFALADNDAARLKAELDWAWKALAARITDDMFRDSGSALVVPEGRAGEALPLGGRGAHLANGVLAERAVMQAALEAPGLPRVSQSLSRNIIMYDRVFAASCEQTPSGGRREHFG
jgi:hypothetical protein